MLSLGDSGELSPNASVMLRVSTLSAWAELMVASPRQKYLEKVVNPHRAILASLWVASLRDYASIKGDSEVFQDGGSTSIDSPYAGLGREVLLPVRGNEYLCDGHYLTALLQYYEDSWSGILHAVATSMAMNDPYILAAMDGLDTTESKTTQKTNRDRDEPTAMFFALFGLIYEALVTSSADANPSTKIQQNSVIALEALKSLVKPEYSGKVLLEPTILDEFTGLCYRMALTESALVQVHLVEAVASFANGQADRLKSLAKM